MSYTKLGSGVWMWSPFRNLVRHPEDDVGRMAQLMWFALYTTPEAKMQVPGMFIGSITTIAESAGFPVDRARVYLDRLIEDDLVEYDVQRRVLRLVALPDCGESPTNGNAIRGWWRRFQNIPACAVRDSHVAVLGWILAEWCRVHGKSLSKDHQDAWAETFGRVAIPAPRPRPKRHVQTSLLLESDRLALPSGASDSGSTEDFTPQTQYLSSPSHSGSPSNDFNRNSYNDRLTAVKREKDPDRDQDRDLRSPDPEGGAGGPMLRLVPRAPFDADDLVEALAGAHKAEVGTFPSAVTRAQRAALGRAIECVTNVGSGQGVLALLREYIVSGAPGMDVPKQPSNLTAKQRHEWPPWLTVERVSSPGWLSHAIEHATSWKAEQQTAADLFSDARRQLGYE